MELPSQAGSIIVAKPSAFPGSAALLCTARPAYIRQGADRGEHRQAAGAAAPILTGDNVGGQNNFCLAPSWPLFSRQPSKSHGRASARRQRASYIGDPFGAVDRYFEPLATENARARPARRKAGRCALQRRAGPTKPSTPSLKSWTAAPRPRRSRQRGYGCHDKKRIRIRR